MACFDYLADQDSVRLADHWQEQAALARRSAYDSKRLTDLRGQFLKDYALDKPNNRGQGPGKILACRSMAPGLDTAGRSAEEALAGFPRYSARLLLRWRLLTPLLTRDDDPFYLFDNPVRKDHILGLPYLSAAGLKGLAADAYQRAFCDLETWQGLGAKDPERTHAFRLQDPHALRLFGLADDGLERDDGTGRSQAGRLHFSPVWFQKVQLLVMNPTNIETATGKQPIQFEAIAADQEGLLELVYFNPYGTPQSDAAIVRADLARLLASLAAWWPVLGLGAKRLAGYGAIEPLGVELQGLGWAGLKEKPATGTPAAPAAVKAPAPPPPYYGDYADGQGLPIPAETLEQRIRERMADLERDVSELDRAWRKLQGKAQSKAKKAFDKQSRSLAGREQQMRSEHSKVVAYFQAHGPARTPGLVAEAAPPAPSLPALALGYRTETGPQSWQELAQWLAGETP